MQWLGRDAHTGRCNLRSGASCSHPGNPCPHEVSEKEVAKNEHNTSSPRGGVMLYKENISVYTHVNSFLQDPTQRKEGGHLERHLEFTQKLCRNRQQRPDRSYQG